MWWRPLLVFISTLLCYHGIEFGLQFAFNRSMISFDSLLLSANYEIAVAAAVLEFVLESFFFPGLKSRFLSSPVSTGGLCVAIAGYAIRVAGIITAGSSFTHEIQTSLRREHKMVDHGIYRYIRHPGYLGWLLFSVFLQLYLGNFVCFLGFARVSWTFFADRIPYEEDYLVRMFGDRYRKYRAQTRTWIPFIP